MLIHNHGSFLGLRRVLAGGNRRAGRQTLLRVAEFSRGATRLRRQATWRVWGRPGRRDAVVAYVRATAAGIAARGRFWATGAKPGRQP